MVVRPTVSRTTINYSQDQVQEKIERLKRPKGFSCSPILIHVNGVTEDLVERDYFANIIDFSAFLSGK